MWTVRDFQSKPLKESKINTGKHTHTQSSGFQWSRNTIIQLTVHYKWAANCLWSITWPPAAPAIGWLGEWHKYQVSNWLGDVWWNRWSREEVYSQETTLSHWVFPQAAEVDTHTHTNKTIPKSTPLLLWLVLDLPVSLFSPHRLFSSA